jgi:hypothetical protein
MQMVRVVLVASVVTIGCVTSATYAQWNQQSMDEIRPRAAFDLHCPKEQLKFTPLVGKEGDLVTQYGVECDGKSVVYVRLHNGNWVANSESH